MKGKGQLEELDIDWRKTMKRKDTTIHLGPRFDMDVVLKIKVSSFTWNQIPVV
jgi:hypothetical protein